MNAPDPRDRFNVRVLACSCPHDFAAEIAKVGAEWEGVVRMVAKAEHFVVKAHGLRVPAALILKEAMLSKGGDCAIHRDAITHKVERSDCVLMGSEKAFSHLFDDLRAQPFDLPSLAEEIQHAIENVKRTEPLTPSDEVLSERLRRFYAAVRTRTAIMGILNVTPDSFSDGGQHATTESAVEHGLRMADDGADVLDIGGESSRPGAEPVSLDDELARVIPVIEALRNQTQTPISIDTYKPEVARAALDAGADIINDITGLADAGMRSLAAERRCPVVVMHMLGDPRTMQENPTYEDVISEIMAFLRERIGLAVEAGLPRELLIMDPGIGIGFGKTAEHNVEILRKLRDFRSLGLPILIGTSRKAFIGKALGGVPSSERIFGTAATVALSIANGANIIRVHDVKEMSQVARMADAMLDTRS